jgi:hypothetical protein
MPVAAGCTRHRGGGGVVFHRVRRTIRQRLARCPFVLGRVDRHVSDGSGADRQGGDSGEPRLLLLRRPARRAMQRRPRVNVVGQEPSLARPGCLERSGSSCSLVLRQTNLSARRRRKVRGNLRWKACIACNECSVAGNWLRIFDGCQASAHSLEKSRRAIGSASPAPTDPGCVTPAGMPSLPRSTSSGIGCRV